jgi:hypothetical protein
LEETMDPDISIWQKTGHFYFALTPGTALLTHFRVNAPLKIGYDASHSQRSSYDSHKSMVGCNSGGSSARHAE